MPSDLMDAAHAQVRADLARVREAVDARTGGEALRPARAALRHARALLATLGCDGSALVLEEVLALMRAIARGEAPARSETEGLVRGAIERWIGAGPEVHAPAADRPARVLALLDDLRSVRGAPLYSTSPLLALPAAPAVAPAAGAPQGLAALARRRRAEYQRGLVEWLRASAPEQGARRMARAASDLAERIAGTAGARLWSVSAALLEALVEGRVERGPALRRLLANLDAELRRLAEEGGAAARADPPPGLLRALAHRLALARGEAESVPAPEDAGPMLVEIRAAVAASRRGVDGALATGEPEDPLPAVRTALGQADDAFALLAWRRPRAIVRAAAAAVDEVPAEGGERRPALDALSRALMQLEPWIDASAAPAADGDPGADDVDAAFAEGAAESLRHVRTLLRTLRHTPWRAALLDEVEREVHAVALAARAVRREDCAELASALARLVASEGERDQPVRPRFFELMDVTGARLEETLARIGEGLREPLPSGLYGSAAAPMPELGAIRAAVADAGGSLRVDDAASGELHIRLELPAGSRVARVAVLRAGNARYAVPLAAVDEVLDAADAEIAGAGSRAGHVERHGRDYRLRPLPESGPDAATVVLVHDRGGLCALLVDAVEGPHEVLLSPPPESAPGVEGHAHLSDGVVPLLDPAVLAGEPRWQPARHWRPQ